MNSFRFTILFFIVYSAYSHFFFILKKKNNSQQNRYDFQENTRMPILLSRHLDSQSRFTTFLKNLKEMKFFFNLNNENKNYPFYDFFKSPNKDLKILFDTPYLFCTDLNFNKTSVQTVLKSKDSNKDNFILKIEPRNICFSCFFKKITILYSNFMDFAFDLDDHLKDILVDFVIEIPLKINIPSKKSNEQIANQPILQTDNIISKVDNILIQVEEKQYEKKLNFELRQLSMNFQNIIQSIVPLNSCPINSILNSHGKYSDKMIYSVTPQENSEITSNNSELGYFTHLLNDFLLNLFSVVSEEEKHIKLLSFLRRLFDKSNFNESQEIYIPLISFTQQHNKKKILFYISIEDIFLVLPKNGNPKNFNNKIFNSFNIGNTTYLKIQFKEKQTIELGMLFSVHIELRESDLLFNNFGGFPFYEIDYFPEGIEKLYFNEKFHLNIKFDITRFMANTSYQLDITSLKNTLINSVFHDTINSFLSVLDKGFHIDYFDIQIPMKVSIKSANSLYQTNIEKFLNVINNLFSSLETIFERIIQTKLNQCSQLVLTSSSNHSKILSDGVIPLSFNNFIAENFAQIMTAEKLLLLLKYLFPFVENKDTKDLYYDILKNNIDLLQLNDTLSDQNKVIRIYINLAQWKLKMLSQEHIKSFHAFNNVKSKFKSPYSLYYELKLGTPSNPIEIIFHVDLNIYQKIDALNSNPSLFENQSSKYVSWMKNTVEIKIVIDEIDIIYDTMFKLYYSQLENKVVNDFLDPIFWFELAQIIPKKYLNFELFGPRVFIKCILCETKEVDQAINLFNTNSKFHSVVHEQFTEILSIFSNFFKNDFNSNHVDFTISLLKHILHKSDELQKKFENLNENQTFKDKIVLFVCISIILILFSHPFFLSTLRNIYRQIIWSKDQMKKSKFKNLVSLFSFLLRKKKSRDTDSTFTLYNSELVPLFVRLAIPFSLIANFIIFIIVQSLYIFEISLTFKFMGINLYFINHKKVSIMSSIESIWYYDSPYIALCTFILSVLWPYVKIFALIFLWFTKTTPYNLKFRQSILNFIDQFGKWSFLEIFLIIFIIFTLDVNVNNADLPYLPSDFVHLYSNFIFFPAMYLFSIGLLMCIFLSNSIFFYNEKVNNHYSYQDLCQYNNKSSIFYIWIYLKNDKSHVNKFSFVLTMLCLLLCILFNLMLVFIPLFYLEYVGLASILNDFDSSFTSKTISISNFFRVALQKKYGYFLYFSLYLTCSVIVTTIIRDSIIILTLFRKVNLSQALYSKTIIKILNSWSSIDVFTVIVFFFLLKVDERTSKFIQIPARTLTNSLSVLEMIGKRKKFTFQGSICGNIGHIYWGMYILVLQNILSSLSYSIIIRKVNDLIEYLQIQY